MASFKSRWAMLAVALMTARLSGVSGAPHVPNLTLRDGVKMPMALLGSGGDCGPDSMGGPYPCSWYNASLSGLRAGYRGAHDALSYCAQYGLGAAVKEFLKTNTEGVTRKDLFLISMVPKYLMGYSAAKLAVKASLKQLGVDYLDLVLIHHRAADIADWPRSQCVMESFPNGSVDWMVINGSTNTAEWSVPPCAQYANDPSGNWLNCQDETWQALIDLKKSGLVRSIGVSNWKLSNLQRMEKLGMELPTVNQIESHVGYHEDDLIQWCNERGIVVQAASPLARAAPGLIAKAGENHSIPAITDIASKYKKTPAQVALRFLVEKGVAVIPWSGNPTYQEQNLDIFDFNLTTSEVRTLNRVALTCRGKANMGLQKCWGDPAVMMCSDSMGNQFHCP